MQPKIPFGRPMLDDVEIAAVTEVLKSGTLVHGSQTHQFEHDFADRVGTRHAIAVSSCTAGLHLALFVQDIGPGHRVALPAMTHVATAHVIELQGATPVFVDVARATGNIDADALAAVNGPLSAAMVVHYLGLPCDMARINVLAQQRGFQVIEDCALAIDAEYDGVKAGNLGRVASFSFYPVKHMTSIEGGMVTTNDDKLAAAISARRAFGYDRTIGQRTKPGIYDVNALGFNYRMSEVEAAVGLVQLRKLDQFQRQRQENHAILAGVLSEFGEVTVFPATYGAARSSHYCLNATLPEDGSIDRDVVVAELNANGIGTSVHYPSAVPLFTYYREKYGFKRGQFPVAEWIAAQTISLPVGPHVTPEQSKRIGTCFGEALKKAKRGKQ